MSLKEMAANGYGHWLRSSIPREEKDLKYWSWQLKEAQQRVKNIEGIIESKEQQLQKSKDELATIERDFPEVEPKKELT